MPAVPLTIYSVPKVAAAFARAVYAMTKGRFVIRSTRPDLNPVPKMVLQTERPGINDFVKPECWKTDP